MSRSPLALQPLQPTRIVIIGAGYAGLLATLRLASRTRRLNREIILISASDTFIERTRWHQIMTGQTVKTWSLPKLVNRRGVRFVQGWVTDIDLNKREVQANVNGEMQHFAYDRLVYALGSHADINAVPGVSEHAYHVALKGERSVTALSKRLPELAKANGRVLVVGGGLTGIEVATEIAESYPALRVTSVMAETLGARLSRRGATYLKGVFTRFGIDVVENVEVVQIEANAARLRDGRALPFDACVWAGSFAVSPFARQVGLAVNERGQVRVDPLLQSVSHPEVYAIGDAAWMEGAGFTLRMAEATANPMGATAADNLAAWLHGRPQQPLRFGYPGQCISLGRRAALVQLTDKDDHPRGTMRGRLGAWYKEFVLRAVNMMLFNERRVGGTYIWLKPKRAPEMAEATLRHTVGETHA